MCAYACVYGDVLGGGGGGGWHDGRAQAKFSISPNNCQEGHDAPANKTL